MDTSSVRNIIGPWAQSTMIERLNESISQTYSFAFASRMLSKRWQLSGWSFLNGTEYINQSWLNVVSVEFSHSTISHLSIFKMKHNFIKYINYIGIGSTCDQFQVLQIHNLKRTRPKQTLWMKASNNWLFEICGMFRQYRLKWNRRRFGQFQSFFSLNQSFHQFSRLFKVINEFMLLNKKKKTAI